MRRCWTAILASIASLGGCTSFIFERGPGPDATCSSLAWPLIDAGFALAAASGAERCNTAVCGLGAAVALPSALLSGASAVFGAIEHSRCTTRRERQRFTALAPLAAPAQPDARIVADTRERAWQITRRAAAAARTDNCASVIELDAQVRQLDEEFHAIVFARDAAIARCFGH
jgi:hypothetical protein